MSSWKWKLPPFSKGWTQIQFHNSFHQKPISCRAARSCQWNTICIALGDVPTAYKTTLKTDRNHLTDADHLCASGLLRHCISLMVNPLSTTSSIPLRLITYIHCMILLYILTNLFLHLIVTLNPHYNKQKVTKRSDVWGHFPHPLYPSLSLTQTLPFNKTYIPAGHRRQRQKEETEHTEDKEAKSRLNSSSDAHHDRERRQRLQ